MKKPRKPKAKRPVPIASAPAAAPRRPGANQLGDAAVAFLRGHAPVPNRSAGRNPAGASKTKPATGPLALGAAARAFVRSAPAARPTHTQSSPLADSLDQREIVTLLLMPFLLVAMALGMSQTWRHPLRTAEPIRPAAPVAAAPQRPVIVEIAPPALRLPPTPPVIEAPEVRLAAPALRLPLSPPMVEAPEITLATPALRLPDTAPAVEPPVIEIAAPLLVLPVMPPVVDVPEVRLAAPMLRLPEGPPAVEVPDVRLAAPQLALPPGPPVIAAGPTQPAVCQAGADFGRHSYAARPVAAGESFGDRLAAAARVQVDDFVIYNDKYRRIAFPMGDVPPMFGVCTDVVIRAYRALGVDLQELVQTARVGSGDASIDHRRTETLRRFLASRGQSLPASSFPEDYRPGDIVTYYRPQNRHSRAHIAIVSDIIAPSGRPMIVHNRGWGPQLEDALFVDRITGHYRFHPAPAGGSMQQVAARTERAVAGRRAAARSVAGPLHKAAYAAAPADIAAPRIMQPPRNAASSDAE